MRQNIDEKWKTDPRRTELAEMIGGRNADGMRVEVNWLLLDYKGQPIPLKVFKFVKDWQAWVTCGLAEVRDEWVHVAGADEYAEFFAKQKSNGDKGGRPRNPVKPKITQTNPTQTHSNPNNPSSSFSFSSSISKKKEKNNAQPDGFAQFWFGYPRKVGKEKTAKLFAKLINSGVREETLFEARDKYVAHLKNEGTEKKFILHGPTFLGRYKDFLEPDFGETKDFSDKGSAGFDWDKVFKEPGGAA